MTYLLWLIPRNRPDREKHHQHGLGQVTGARQRSTTEDSEKLMAWAIGCHALQCEQAAPQVHVDSPEVWP